MTIETLTIVTSIFNGVAGVVLAGGAFWILQTKYAENRSKTNIRHERFRKEEDVFYECFRKTKYALCEMFHMFEEDRGGIDQKRLNDIVALLQHCSDMVEIGGVVLEKYKTLMGDVIKLYNDFRKLIMEDMRKNNLTGDEYGEIISAMTLKRDDIFKTTHKIDELYFNNTKNKTNCKES